MRKPWEAFRPTVAAYFTTDLLSFSDLAGIVLPILWEQAFLALSALLYIRILSAQGESAVAVVSMMGVAGKALTSGCLGLTTGGAVLVAQNRGAGRREEAGRSMAQAMALAVAVTTALSGLLLAFRGPVVGFLLEGADREILEGSLLYFTAFCASFPCYALYQGFAAGMRGWGQTKIAWRLTLAVGAWELLLSALLVAGRGMGVAGVAAATVLSRAGGALMALVLLARRRRELELGGPSSLRPDPALLGGILATAVPLALEQFFFNSGKAVSQRFIAGYGAAHMAANGVVNALFELFNLPQATLREAAIPLVGMAVGGGRPQLARRYLYKFLRAARLTMAGLMPLTLLASALAMSRYGLSAPAARLTVLCLGLIYTFGPLFLAGSFTIPSGLRAGGDAGYVSAVSMGCMWMGRVCLSYLFCRVLPLGVVGLNLAMALEWALRGALFRARLKGPRWWGRRLIAAEESRT